MVTSIREGEGWRVSSSVLREICIRAEGRDELRPGAIPAIRDGSLFSGRRG